MKASRNAQRKAHYAAIADKSSRNQDTITAPLVGRLEWVTSEPIIKVNEETGERHVVGERKVAPYQRVVHDAAAVPGEARPRTAKRATNAQKIGRQERAWARCRLLRQCGAHEGPRDNCKSCGAPLPIEATP